MTEAQLIKTFRQEASTLTPGDYDQVTEFIHRFRDALVDQCGRTPFKAYFIAYGEVEKVLSPQQMTSLTSEAFNRLPR